MDKTNNKFSLFNLFKDGTIYFAICFVVILILALIIDPSIFSGGGSIFVLIIPIPFITMCWIAFCLLQNIFNKERNNHKAVVFGIFIFILVNLIYQFLK